jgi:subtilisin family serine protease
VAGVAWEAQVYGIRLIGGSTTYSDVYDAFVEATDAGAAVISNSWGFTDCQSYLLPAVLRAGLDHAEAEGRGGLGAAVVFSAGNGNCDASDDGLLSHSAVVGVAALNGDDDREWYSSYGDIVDVAAPSGGVLTTDPAGSDGYGSWRDDPDYYGYFSGTSAAAPVVSGVLALMFAANDRLTAAQARQVLAETAERVHPEDFDYDAEGWNALVGAGRVDAGAAVLAVANDAPAAPMVLGPAETAWEDQVALRWAPAEDDDGDWLSYEVTWWRGDDPAAGTVAQIRGEVLDLTGLVVAGDTVTWSVRARDLWGLGEAPTVQQFDVQAPPEPPGPEATGCATAPRAPRHVAWAILMLLGARRWSAGRRSRRFT